MIGNLENWVLVGRPSHHFNFVPSVNEPHAGSFIYLFARSVILPFACILALFPFFSPGENGYEFSTPVRAIFAAFFVFFEEQARWLFASKSKNKKKDCLKFALYFIITENVLYLISNNLPINIFALTRSGSIAVHMINGYICFLSFRYSALMKILIFVAAFSLHFFYNSLAPVLFERLL